MLKVHEQTRKRVHPDCVVCSPDNPAGLRIAFSLCPDGTLKGSFDCSRKFEGYHGLLQGGVVASLLDGMMTNYLFYEGVVAVTAELTTRYRHPVKTGQTVEMFAEVSRRNHDLFILEGRLYQNEKLCATASGKFLAQPQLDPQNQK